MSMPKTSVRSLCALVGIAALSISSCTFYPWWERMIDEQQTSPTPAPSGQGTPSPTADPTDAPPSGTVSDPVISPASGDYDAAKTVTIQCDTENAAIYYSLDGSDPGRDAPGSIRYSAPLSLDALNPNLAIKAIAVRGGMTPSSIVQADFHMNYDRSATIVTVPMPVITPSGGVFELTTIQAANEIVITCPDPLADIYYELNDFDGLLPTIFDDPTIPAGSNRDDATHNFNAYYAGFRGTRRYTGPIHVAASAERRHLYVKAIAVRSGYADSTIAKEHYRKPGYPTVLSCSITPSKSAVEQPVALDIVYQDDIENPDGGLDGLRISCRALGHGTTNTSQDPTMFYIEYRRPNEHQPAESENAFYFYDGVRSAPIIFGSGTSVDMAHYSIDPSECSVLIDDANKKLTFHFEFTPLADEYDQVDGWKNRKSLWTWMMDDPTWEEGPPRVTVHNNTPVTELVRWELTGP